MRYIAYSIDSKRWRLAYARVLVEKNGSFKDAKYGHVFMQNGTKLKDNIWMCDKGYHNLFFLPETNEWYNASLLLSGVYGINSVELQKKEVYNNMLNYLISLN